MLNVEASEITADGGIGFYDWFTQEADNIAFSITPANGKFVELKVDDTSSDGSAAVHFPEGSGSPYGAAVDVYKRQVAYTVFDLNEEISEQALEDLRTIQGIIKVRVIA